MTENEKTTPNTLTAISEGQSSLNTNIIAQSDDNCNSQYDYYQMMMRAMFDPSYLPTMSMSDLYENTYEKKPPIIDGLLYSGTYLFVGAPKIGKSFFMLQLGYHISTGNRIVESSTRADFGEDSRICYCRKSRMDRNRYRIGGDARPGFETECPDAKAQCYGGATLKRIRHSLRKHTHSQRQERNPETKSVTGKCFAFT